MMIDNHEEVAVETACTSAQKPLSLFGLFNLNLFWFASHFQAQALLTLALPSMIAHFLDPHFKAINLLAVVMPGTVVACLLTPLAGAFSDTANVHMGRRRLFLLLGTVPNIIVLILFAFTSSWVPQRALLVSFTVLFLFLQLSSMLANAPWSAVTADQVPWRQRGLSCGLGGLLTLLGTAIGSIIAGSLLGGNLSLPAYERATVEVFQLVAVIQTLVVLYTLVTVKETPLPPDERPPFHLWRFVRGFFFHPSTYPDLSWVLLGRFFMKMGSWSVLYFLVYYFQDVLGGPGTKLILFNTPFSAERFNGVLFQPLLLLMAVPTALLGGWASDRWGRKRLIYLSGGLMILGCLIFLLFRNQSFTLIASACLGIAYGAYESADSALTVDVLPPTNEAGKFMGIWSTIGILPQFVATAISGVLLQLLQPLPNHFNYTVLFLLTMIYVFLATLVVARVKGSR